MPTPGSPQDSAAARLAGLLDSAMDAIVSIDESQRIVQYNAAAERIFGWPAAEAIGQPLTLLLPERFHASHANFVRRFGATGVSSRRMSGSTVVHGRRSNGEEFPVDASISQLATPEGRIFTVILRDATDRVTGEREQARLASRLSGLLDAAMDGIVTVDEGNRIVLYNRAAERMFGWPAVQVMGRSLDLLIPPRFRTAHRQHLARFGQTGVTTRGMGTGAVLHALRANGTEFPVEASISQVDTPDGKLYSVIVRDITQRVQAEEDLAAFAAEAANAREAEKARIARELHDDLAQALTAAKMDVAQVRRQLRTDPDAALRRLDELEAMLDASAAATRRIATDLRPMVLDDLGLVPALQWLTESFTARTQVDCDLDADESLELEEPFATSVFRIVQESLANVRKHARARHVQVRVGRKGEGLEVCVRDDGDGFELHGPRKRESLGIVGLRERARLVHGRLEIESAPGRGTEVVLHMPLEGATPSS